MLRIFSLIVIVVFELLALVITPFVIVGKIASTNANNFMHSVAEKAEKK